MWGNGKKVVYIESNYTIIMTRTQRTHTQNLTGTDRKERRERSHADVYDVVTTTFPITTNHSDTKWFTNREHTEYAVHNKEGHSAQYEGEHSAKFEGEHSAQYEGSNNGIFRRSIRNELSTALLNCSQCIE